MFPDDILSPRALVNRPGLTFDALRLSNFYAEDANDMSGNIVAIENWLLDHLLVDYFPHVCILWPYDFKVLVGGAITYLVTAAAIFNCTFGQSGFANGDSCESSFVCAAGDYDVKVLYTKTSQSGIVDFYIDDVLVDSGMDKYAAAAAINTVYTFQVSDLTAGRHTFKWVVNGKNASSSSYYFRTQRFSIILT